MLAEIMSGRCSTKTAARAATRRAATRAGSDAPSSSTANNSSPLSRATRLPGPTTRWRRLRREREDLVPGGVTEGVVDGLELVEVDDQHGGWRCVEAPVFSA